ncbi:MAG: outer membrane protein transport protein [Polyangiales bacterium]
MSFRAVCLSTLLSSLASLALLEPPLARAAGVEETVAGSVTLGRAANAGRANDFMAIMLNPANLAVIPGGDLGGELRLALFNACYDRARDRALSYREPSESFQGSESFANVCNEGAPFPTGNLGWAQSFENGFGWGVGFFTPPGVAQSKWGRDRIVTVLPAEDERYPITESGVEYPNRHMLLERRALAGWLMLGAGYQPIPTLRFGLSLGAGFFTLYNKNTSSVSGGFASDPELINEASGSDWFVPRATASMVYAPTPSFEAFASLTYQADVDASGHVDLTANGIRDAPLRNCRSARPGPHCRIENVRIKVPFPTLEATLGLRYAERRVGRTRVLDPLKDERWDVALELGWTQTSHVKEFGVQMVQPGETMPPQISFSSGADARAVGTPPTANIPRYWKDTWSVRLGGDYNLIAEKLAVRLGLSYAGTAVPGQYMNIDLLPVRKIGLHLGATSAYKRLKLTIAYAHLFYEKVTVPVGSGEVREITSQPPEPQAVNEGFYHAQMDVISGQMNISF